MRRGSLAGSSALTMMQRAAPHQRSVDHVCDSAIASRESRARHRAKAGRGAGVGSEGPRQAGQGRGRVQQQRPEPQPQARPAQLSRSVDGRVGLHRGPRDRGLQRRRRHCRRTGGAPADGSVRDPGAVAVPAGRPGPQGAGADPGLHAARDRHGRGRGRRRAVGPDVPSSTCWRCCRRSPTTLYRPAHSALLPSLCRTGYELASANVVRGLLDSAATLVGPLLAALLLQVAGVAAVFSMAAAASLWAALLLTRLRYEAPPRPPRRQGQQPAALRCRGSPCGQPER